MQEQLANSWLSGHRRGVCKHQRPWRPCNEMLSTPSSFINSMPWHVNGSGPLLCLNAPIGNCAANFVRPLPLAALLVPRPLYICKFSGFMLGFPKANWWDVSHALSFSLADLYP